MKFGQFANSSTSYPKITISIPDAPLRGAICIGQLVDEFENSPNFIDTFWQLFSKNLRPI